MNYIMARTNTNDEILKLLGACLMYSNMIQLEISMYTSFSLEEFAVDPVKHFDLVRGTMGYDKIKKALKERAKIDLTGAYDNIIEKRNAIIHAMPTNELNKLAYFPKDKEDIPSACITIDTQYLLSFISECRSFLDLLEKNVKLPRPPWAGL